MRRFDFIAFTANCLVEREFRPFAAIPAIVLGVSHRDLLRLCGCAQPMHGRLPLPAQADGTGKVLFGGGERGECRLALPQELAYVGSVSVGSLGFGP